ncbi:MAG: aldo/keto reductase [Candidatus Sumerlaeia bacterium]|nr:aldo/keto reductase [Candidatus Sumerlaeia bacterium]
MDPRLSACPIAFGAFKIGRNQGIKYPSGYELPSDAEAEALLNGALDLGVRVIDTAPAYGVSEERIGLYLAHRRAEFWLSTKAGERFEGGRSHYDFSRDAIARSIDESLARLRTDRLDSVLLHLNAESESRDLGPARDALLAAQAEGKVGLVGASPVTEAGLRQCLPWAQILMAEVNPLAAPLDAILAGQQSGRAPVLVKKAFASGRLAPEEALRFALGKEYVAAVVVGTLSLEHLAENVRLARALRGDGPA